MACCCRVNSGGLLLLLLLCAAVPARLRDALGKARGCRVRQGVMAAAATDVARRFHGCCWQTRDALCFRNRNTIRFTLIFQAFSLLLDIEQLNPYMHLWDLALSDRSSFR